MHKHVAALLHSLAVSEGSDEPKPRLVVEPLHTASEPSGFIVAAIAAAIAAATAVYWADVVSGVAAALVGCTHGCFRSDKKPRSVFKFVFGISVCFIFLS